MIDDVSVEARFNVLYKKYYDNIKAFLKLNPNHGIVLRKDMPIYQKRLIVKHEDDILSCTNWNTINILVNSVKDMARDYPQGFIVVASKYLGKSYKVSVPMPEGYYNTKYKPPFIDIDDLSFHEIELLFLNSREIIAEDKVVKTLLSESNIHKAFCTEVLGNKLRAKYYARFCSSNTTALNDEAFCISNLLRLDLFIDRQLLKSYSDIAQKYPFGVDEYEQHFSADIVSIVENIEKIKELHEDVVLCRRKVRPQLENKAKYVKLARAKSASVSVADKSTLNNCISNWEQNAYGLPLLWMYPYYPTSCTQKLTREQENYRYLIWSFKNDYERKIRFSHDYAMNFVIEQSCELLEQKFDSHLSKLTLVCVTASTKEKNDRRYKDFADILCRKTGMTNGFPYVSVDQDGGAKHKKETQKTIVSFNRDFFKGKIVLLFDDVMTSGKSINCFKEKLEENGASVLCCMTIGKTVHE